MMPPNMIIMRFTAEGQDDKLLAPEYCRPSWKNKVKQMVEQELLRRNSRQGSRCPFNRHIAF
jgi:radical SAM superfamily enzyme